MMPYIGAEINQEARVMVEITPVVVEIRIASIVVRAIAEGTALHTGKNAKSAVKIIISNQYAEVMVMTNMTPVDQGQRKATGANNFMK